MSTPLTSTPLSDGFVMPGEFERQTKCWISWPYRTDNWRLDAQPARAVFAAVVAAIARFEPISVLVRPQDRANAEHLVGSIANATLVECTTDDCWTRDTGPTFVVRSSAESGSRSASTEAQTDLRGVDWIFNSWGGAEGGCYAEWAADDAVAGTILQHEKALRYRTDFVLEGGSIHSDGEGTILTTEECLLNPNRNPHLTRQQIEAAVCAYTGARKIVWIPHGVYGDEDTNGHVDNILMYVRPAEVALLWTDDESDPQYPRSRAALEILQKETDACGRSFKIHKVLQPSPSLRTLEESQTVVSTGNAVQRPPGERLPASYINCLLVNGAVILPTFGDDVHDKLAVQKMQEIFPDREIVPIYSREIVLGGGNIHCITQHQPAPRS